MNEGSVSFVPQPGGTGRHHDDPNVSKELTIVSKLAYLGPA